MPPKKSKASPPPVKRKASLTKPKTSTTTAKKTSTLSLNKPGTAAKKPLKSITEFHKPLAPVNTSSQPIPSRSSTQEPLSAGSKGKERAQLISAPADQLWVDQFAPLTEADLAVHKRKVEDVRRWLLDALDNEKMKKYRRVLALTGPAGVGKTATLRVLARELDIEIVEWRNGMDDDFDGEYESLALKFQNFLERASSYHSLSFTAPSTASSSQRTSKRRQLILIEDLPNILHPSTRDAFHATLNAFATSPEPPLCPIVFIISHVGVRGEAKDERGRGRGWGEGGDAAVDVRSVIPPSLFTSSYFIELQFNPVAITLLRKAVSALLDKAFAEDGTHHRPPKDAVEMILESAHGDIRSAVMALQFACIIDLPIVKGKGKSKAGKKGARGVLEAITHREQSLALFHILGKLMYNKRYGDPEETEEAPYSVPALPKHLRSEHKRRLSKVDANVLYADSPIDTPLLSLYAHQNYTQFCETIEECEALMDNMSDVDLIGESGSGEISGLFPHAFQLLTLGTLHALPSPVPRKGQKTFKPDFFEVLNKKKEAEAAVLDARTWLGGWGRDVVVLETGGILKALSRTEQAPSTFNAFASLQFVKATPVGGVMADEDGYSEPEPEAEEDLLAESRARRKEVEEPVEKGWLSDDEIDDDDN